METAAEAAPNGRRRRCDGDAAADGVNCSGAHYQTARWTFRYFRCVGMMTSCRVSVEWMSLSGHNCAAAIVEELGGRCGVLAVF
uniref:Uncharacterized protein n=1 Tax=Plectus sambesii TaxID=2011161 RepID=A0A914V2B2_9BILA